MSKVKRKRNQRKRLNQQNEETKQEIEQGSEIEIKENLTQENKEIEENAVEKETTEYNKKKYSYDFKVVSNFFKRTTEKIKIGYKKNKQAWKNIFLFSLSLIIIVMTIGNVTNHIIGGKVTNSYSDYSKYSIKYDKMLDRSGTYYVYMYSESCSHCNDLKKYIFQYLDSDKNSSTNGVKLFIFCVDDHLDELTSESDNIIGVNDVHDLKVSSTPTMMLVVDGTVMNVWSTPSTIKNQLSI